MTNCLMLQTLETISSTRNPDSNSDSSASKPIGDRVFWPTIKMDPVALSHGLNKREGCWHF